MRFPPCFFFCAQQEMFRNKRSRADAISDHGEKKHHSELPQLQWVGKAPSACSLRVAYALKDYYVEGKEVCSPEVQCCKCLDKIPFELFARTHLDWKCSCVDQGVDMSGFIRPYIPELNYVFQGGRIAMDLSAIGNWCADPQFNDRTRKPLSSRDMQKNRALDGLFDDIQGAIVLDMYSPLFEQSAWNLFEKYGSDAKCDRLMLKLESYKDDIVATEQQNFVRFVKECIANGTWIAQREIAELMFDKISWWEPGTVQPKEGKILFQYPGGGAILEPELKPTVFAKCTLSWGPTVDILCKRAEVPRIRVLDGCYMRIAYPNDENRRIEDTCSNFLMRPLARVGQQYYFMQSDLDGQVKDVVIPVEALATFEKTISILKAHGVQCKFWGNKEEWCQLVGFWQSEARRLPQFQCHEQIGRVAPNLYILSNELQVVCNDETGQWTFSDASQSGHVRVLPHLLSAKQEEVAKWAFTPRPDTRDVSPQDGLEFIRSALDLQFESGTNIAPIFFAHAHTWMGMYASDLSVDGLEQVPALDACCSTGANKSVSVKSAQAMQYPFGLLPLHIENESNIKVLEQTVACVKNMTLVIDDCSAIDAQKRAEFIKTQTDRPAAAVQSVSNSGEGIAGVEGLERRAIPAFYQPTAATISGFSSQLAKLLPSMYRALPLLLEQGDKIWKTWETETFKTHMNILPEGKKQRAYAMLLHFGIHFGALLKFPEEWVLERFKEFLISENRASPEITKLKAYIEEHKTTLQSDGENKYWVPLCVVYEINTSNTKDNAKLKEIVAQLKKSRSCLVRKAERSFQKAERNFQAVGKHTIIKLILLDCNKVTQVTQVTQITQVTQVIHVTHVVHILVSLLLSLGIYTKIT